MSRARIWAGSVALVVVPILLVWIGIAAHLAQERGEVQRHAVEEAGNLARGFGENVGRMIDDVDRLAKVLRNVRARDKGAFDLAKLVPPTDALNGLTLQIATTDSKGMMTASNLPNASLVDLSDREHIRVHTDNPGTDELFISRPVLGRVSQKWSIQFTRKLLDADGHFDGVIVISLDPYYLSRFYESLDIGNGSVALFGVGDGVVRARAPKPEAAIGRVMPEAALAAIRNGERSGDYRLRSTVDGVDRIYAYRRLDWNNLAVAVGLDTNEVFAAYRRDVMIYGIAGALMSGFIAIAGSLLALQRRRLIDSRRWLSATLDNISQGILMVDRNGDIQVANRRAIELFRLPDDMLAQTRSYRVIYNMLAARGEFGPNPPAGIELIEAMEKGEVPPPYERERADGSTLEVRTQFLPDGSAVRTFTDVTERKRTETALADARDAAEAASRARHDFLAMMSHEIRTPMNGVIGMAGLLLDSALNPAQRRFAETLQDAAANLLRIINDILDFSKLDRGRMEFESIPFDLAHVIASVTDLLSVKAQAKGLYLTARIDPTTPLRLRGDPGRLRQVLLNLVDNGLKFTETGGVTITVWADQAQAGKTRVRFMVRDSGIGMNAETLGLLFRHFAQGDSSISRRFGGTGLGLAISKRLVERMGGAIGVDSVQGDGTTFRFDVLLDIDMAPIPAPAAAPEAGTMRSLRILLAEDNATNRIVAEKRLERMGHRVDSVANGIEAVEAVRTIPYDMVLMDVMMPDMDGLSATRAIRRLPPPAGRIPIVAMTANVFREHEVECREAGMDAFLPKPATPDQFTRAITEALAAREPEVAAES